MYLGLIFQSNGNFVTARKNLIQQSQKSLYALMRRIRNVNLPIDLQLKLFDTLVVPVLLYSSEVWGFENINEIEKVHLHFLKKTLGVRKSTSNYMVYGESGRYPLQIQIKIRMLNFWKRLVENPDKLSGILYRLLFKLHGTQNFHFKWIEFIKNIFVETGLFFVWNGQHTLHKEDIKGPIKQIFWDNFIQNWYSSMSHSSRGELYIQLKPEFGLEKYLLRLSSKNRQTLCRFRCSNFKIPIETGRWVGISLEHRTCHICNSGEIGNEYHYLFECVNNQLRDMRQKYIPSYYTRYPSIHKMNGLLTICNTNVLNNLCVFLRFVQKIM